MVVYSKTTRVVHESVISLQSLGDWVVCRLWHVVGILPPHDLEIHLWNHDASERTIKIAALGCSKQEPREGLLTASLVIELIVADAVANAEHLQKKGGRRKNNGKFRPEARKRPWEG